MAKLIFSLPYGISFRNIVCCGILDKCLEKGAAATLLLPDLTDRDRGRIESQLPAGVDVRRLLPAAPYQNFRFLKLIKQHLYAKRTGLDSFRVKNDRLRHQRPLMHLGTTALARFAETLCTEQWVDSRIARARQPFEDYYDTLLEERRVDTVVVAKPGYQPEDLALIRAARRRKIPVVSVDTTWDNIVSKRPTYLPPDVMTAWSARMQDEAVEFYQMPRDKVAITGGAQFDVLAIRSRLPVRERFLESLGLDPGRRLIVFALNSPVFTPQNPLYISFLLEAVRTGAIKGAPNVIIRLHPWDLVSNHDALIQTYSNVRVERPFGVPDAASVYECIPSRDEVVHFGALMNHADVLVNIASTTTLDAIAADTPVTSLAFDMEPAPAELSSARLYELSHLRPIVDSQAVRVVREREELIEVINSYLDDRTIDRPARDRARRSFMTFSDGGSAGRIADVIGGLS